MEPDRDPTTGDARLLAVRLRLDGLAKRLARIDRQESEGLDRVPEELRSRIEICALEMGLHGVERGLEGVVKALCLALDGTLPDEEDWLPSAVAQLAGTGRGRAPVLSADLADLLLQVREDIRDRLIDDGEERLRRLRGRREAARRAASRLGEAVAALNGPVVVAPPDPKLLEVEPGRLARAAERRRALRRAAAAIVEAFAARGRRAVPFGSVLAGSVHGRSDLDMMVPGEVTGTERSDLRDLAEEIAAAEGIELDLHFESFHSAEVLDEMWTIRDGRVLSLRELVDEDAGPGPAR